MKLDLNKKMKFFNGEESTDTIGQILASILIAMQTSNGMDAVKYISWATKLYNNEVIDLDKSDYTVLKKIVSETDQLRALPKAQIYELLLDLDK